MVSSPADVALAHAKYDLAQLQGRNARNHQHWEYLLNSALSALLNGKQHIAEERLMVVLADIRKEMK